MARPVRIVGCGTTALNPRPVPSPSRLMQQALDRALDAARITVADLDGLIAVPSLADPRFMEAHNLSTQIGLLPQRDVIVRTIDTGGAGPINAILEAKRLIESEGRSAVAVVAGDAVSSLSKAEFLARADQSCQDPDRSLPSPVIPHGSELYDRIAQWQAKTYGTTREQFAMCSVLMSQMASRHPTALTRTPHTLQQVLAAAPVAPCTTLLECARRADGAAAVLVASDAFVRRMKIPATQTVVVISGGEASGSLYPPPMDQINEDVFSCQQAAQIAFTKAQLGVADIDYFGLYDCFPICLIRAIEAVGLAALGRGGDFVQAAFEAIASRPDLDQIQDLFPINTHGGLLSFGAPWEAPALFAVIEAVQQLTTKAGRRQVRDAKRALVYGNGGIFSSSAVVILGRGHY